MIIGLGTDLVSCERMRKWLSNGMLERFFTKAEVIYIRSQGQNSVQAMAARFAAKEAFGKALGTGLRNISLLDISIEKEAAGRPQLQVQGQAQEILAKLGNPRIHVSISHEKDYALATVLLETKGGQCD